MNILMLTNPQVRCGVALYGRNWAEAMRNRGHHVWEWHSTPGQPVPPRGVTHDFQVCFINWMAGTVPHLRPEHLPPMPRGMFMHETYPEGNRDRHPLWDHVHVLFGSEPCEPEVVYIPMPCPDHEPTAIPPSDQFVIGHTGLRRLWDGLIIEAARIFSERSGVQCSTSFSDGWREMPSEVERLAACHVVCQVNSGGWGGQSSGTMTAIAARRPLVLLRARQLATLFGHEDQLYFATAENPEAFADQFMLVYEELATGAARRPTRLADDRSWAKAAESYEQHLRRLIA